MWEPDIIPVKVPEKHLPLIDHFNDFIYNHPDSEDYFKPHFKKPINIHGDNFQYFHDKYRDKNAIHLVLTNTKSPDMNSYSLLNQLRANVIRDHINHPVFGDLLRRYPRSSYSEPHESVTRRFMANVTNPKDKDIRNYYNRSWHEIINMPGEAYGPFPEAAQQLETIKKLLNPSKKLSLGNNQFIHYVKTSRKS
jgi:hypothetical protein